MWLAPENPQHHRCLLTAEVAQRYVARRQVDKVRVINADTATVVSLLPA